VVVPLQQLLICECEQLFEVLEQERGHFDGAMSGGEPIAAKAPPEIALVKLSNLADLTGDIMASQRMRGDILPPRVGRSGLGNAIRLAHDVVLRSEIQGERATNLIAQGSRPSGVL
jgi:hypothetical protein